MRTKRDVSIDKDRYVLYQIPPTPALKLLAKLAKLVGGAIGGLNANIKGLDDEIGMSKAIGGLIGGITANLDDAIIDEIVNNVIKGGYVFLAKDGKEIQIDSAIFESHFDGKLKNLLYIIYYVLEVNYKDFLLDAYEKIKEILVAKGILKLTKET